MVSANISKTVLVVDDEINLRHTLALILQRAGYSVTTAGNGYEASNYLQAGPFDLLFLDIKLPDIDGIVLLPEIRSQYPDMPVIILTAHATLDSAIEAVRLGARDYLLKPIEPRQILNRVDEILAESKHPKRRREIVSELQNLLEELNNIEDPAITPADHPVFSPASGPTRFVQRGPFTLDLHARHVLMNEQPVSLSPTAFDYLVTLLRHSPDPLSYQTLVIEAQGYQPSLMEARDLARWRIHELRKAIEPDPHVPQYIITVRGVGYRLVI